MANPGQAFHAHERALIDHFLRPKIDGQPFHFDASFIHDADVCSMAPGDLVRMYTPAPVNPGGTRRGWYFFSPAHYRHGRRSRRLDNGYWREITRPRKVKDGDDIKYMQHYAYWKAGMGAAAVAARRRPEWLMTEYGIAPQGAGAREMLVLCMVFRSPRADP